MNITDFIFDSIYKGAMKQGATEKAAKDQAVMGLDDYRKGKLGNGRVSRLIEKRIIEAKKMKK